MISTLALRCARGLISHKLIDESERELYEYGFFILLSNLIYFLISCVVGAIAGVFVQSVIFYAAFMLIRQYAGGFHAGNEIQCEISTTTSIILSIIIIRLSSSFDLLLILLILGAIAATVIMIFSPLDTAQKRLSDIERRHYRKISCLIIAAYLIITALSVCFKWNTIIYPMCMGMIFEGVLISIGKAQQIYLKTHDIKE